MAGRTRIIHLRDEAPAKPAAGAPCNGCGVCCAAATCPLGRLLFRRRSGPCPALAWQGEEKRYRCRLLTDPGSHWRRLPQAGEGLARRLFARWIAAGTGCDSDAGPD